jgi:hypothetical protein
LLTSVRAILGEYLAGKIPMRTYEKFRRPRHLHRGLLALEPRAASTCHGVQNAKPVIAVVYCKLSDAVQQQLVPCLRASQLIGAVRELKVIGPKCLVCIPATPP